MSQDISSVLNSASCPLNVSCEIIWKFLRVSIRMSRLFLVLFYIIYVSYIRRLWNAVKPFYQYQSVLTFFIFLATNCSYEKNREVLGAYTSDISRFDKSSLKKLNALGLHVRRLIIACSPVYLNGYNTF